MNQTARALLPSYWNEERNLRNMSRTWKISNGTLKPVPGWWRRHIAFTNAGIVLAFVVGGILIVNAVMEERTAKEKAERLLAESVSKAGNGGSAAKRDVADHSVFFDVKSKARATYSLIEKWGVSVDAGKRMGGSSIKKIASGHGFKRFYGPLDMDAIKGIGYPVIFEVKEGKSTGYVPVVGVWGKRFVTDLEAGNYVLKEWVFKRWTGNVYILWKDFKGINRTLKRGSRGGSVKWLHNCLADLGYANLGSNGYYGRITERAVLRFQSNNGVSGGGEAGPLTMMLLYKYLPEYVTPGVVYGLG